MSVRSSRSEWLHWWLLSTSALLFIGNTLALGGNRDWATGASASLAMVGLASLLFLQWRELKKRPERVCGDLKGALIVLLLLMMPLGWALIQHTWPRELGLIESVRRLTGLSDIRLQGPIGSPWTLIEVSLTSLFLFFAAYLMGRSRRWRQRTLVLLLGVQLLVATYGLINLFSGNTYLLWFERTAYPADVTGSFVNRNAYATFAGIGLLLAVHRLTRTWHKLGQGSGRHGPILAEGTQQILLDLLMLLVLVAAWANSHSRAGILSGLVALVGFLWMQRVSAGRSHATETRFDQLRLVGWLLAVFGVGFAMLVLSPQLDTLDARYAQTGEDLTRSRLLVYAQTLEAIRLNPWAGYGVDAFEPLFRVIQSPELGFLHFDKVHNIYLEAAFALGVPVTLLVLAAGLWLVRRLHRADTRLARAVLAGWLLVALHGMVDFGLQIPAILYLMALMSGLALGDAGSTRKRHARVWA